MMLYTLAHPRFFEDVVNVPYDNAYENAVTANIPPGWNTQVSGVWLHVGSPSHRYLEQGFKIHISGRISQAEDIIRIASSVCYDHDTPFKTARDPFMMSIMSSKHYPRGNAGKLMTIYPGSHEAFLKLTEALYQATNAFEGPYILSDRRYRDRGIVYYRYGEILPMSRLTPDGGKRSALTAPDGSSYAEERLPFYKLPPWVEEPFAKERSLDTPSEKIIHGRYRIEKALNFSNSGGIYAARDLKTDRDVVLKEARPHTAHHRFATGEVDAMLLIAHEYHILRKLSGVPGIVQAHDLFTEWEHRFLVEDRVDGIPLSRFRASENFTLVPFDGSADRARTFERKFSVIALALIEIIGAVHDRGVLIGDLSPGNILVDPETLAVCLIDLEGAFAEDSTLPTSFSAQWSTPGFRHDRRIQNDAIAPEDDWFALGMVLYSLIMPMQSLFDMEKTHRDEFLQYLCQCAKVSQCVPDTLRALWDDDHRKARELLIAIGNDEEGVLARAGADTPLPDRLLPKQADALLQDIDVALASLRSPELKSRLWPGDTNIYRSNSISIGYGACGTLLYQMERGIEIDAVSRSWLLDHAPAADELPPGLYIGSAGLAYTLLRFGERDRAMALLEHAVRSPLLDEDDSVIHGRAGVLLACLSFHALTHDDRLLTWASALGDALLDSAKDAGDFLHWDRGNDVAKRRLGFAHGASGIALALLYLAKTVDETRFLHAAHRAIAGETLPGAGSDREFTFGATADTLLREPYWLHGGGGIGTTVVRFWVLCGDQRYLDLAHGIADSVFSLFTVQPGQFEGMSGIGEFMIDMYRFTGQQRYLDNAHRIARSISLYAVNEGGGICFPGRGVERLSCDLAYGSAGVGLFLNRLCRPGPRLLHDLPLLAAHTPAGLTTC